MAGGGAHAPASGVGSRAKSLRTVANWLLIAGCVGLALFASYLLFGDYLHGDGRTARFAESVRGKESARSTAIDSPDQHWITEQVPGYDSEASWNSALTVDVPDGYAIYLKQSSSSVVGRCFGDDTQEWAPLGDPSCNNASTFQFLGRDGPMQISYRLKPN